MGREHGGTSDRNRLVHWLSSADPTRGVLTRRLGLVGMGVVYAVLAAVMGVCGKHLPQLVFDLVGTALLYLFVDFLGWLNCRVPRDEDAFRRNRAWLFLLAVVLLLALILLIAMQLMHPRINRS